MVAETSLLPCVPWNLRPRFSPPLFPPACFLDLFWGSMHPLSLTMCPHIRIPGVTGACRARIFLASPLAANPHTAPGADPGCAGWQRGPDRPKCLLPRRLQREKA